MKVDRQRSDWKVRQIKGEKVGGEKNIHKRKSFDAEKIMRKAD